MSWKTSHMNEPVEAPATTPPPKRRSLALPLVTALLFVAAVVLVVLYLIPENYYAEIPGDAVPVGSLIKVQGHHPKPHQGAFYLTDVTIYKVDNLLEKLYAEANADTDLTK